MKSGIYALLATGCALGAFHTGLSAASFDIAAQDAATGIREFARQSGYQILAPQSAVENRRINAVKGEMAPSDALRTMLHATGIRILDEKDKTITLGKARRDIQMAYLGQVAMAQPQPDPVAPAAASARYDDIIVTARKRDETSIAVPVALTALGGAELERRAINNMDSLARAVPQLVVGEGGGTIQGGNISLRGIGSPDTNPFADQAVSFNVDGVQVARASVRRMSEVDIAQVEVLKGPQALFFGKNSPGGIISIRTADPTQEFEAKVTASYEFNARELRGEGYVSSPITDTLGIRIAGYGSGMRGWVENIVPENAPLQPDRGWGPRSREFGGRVTLKWEPSDRFDARLKFNYGRVRGDDSAANVQFVNCPMGAPQVGGIDECKANDKVSVSNIGPNFGLVDPIFGDGETYLRQSQILSSLEMNYLLTDELTLTSVTGFYHTKLRNVANYTQSYIPEGPLLASVNRFKVREVSQELRLASSFDGPINFMFGGHFQDSHAETGSTTYRHANNPLYNNNYYIIQEGTAWSVFGQLMWEVVPTLELSAGGRISNEKKNIPSVMQGSAAAPELAPVTTAFDKGSWDNFSPEFTVSYRPSDNLTLFGSYKKGFLSGGFNSGAGSFANDLRYNQQTIRGFEGGVKAALFDRTLRTNLTFYTYKTRGLQVTMGVQAANNIVFQTIRNAGRVKTEGAEFDFTYQTPLDGFSLRGAVAYNRGRYAEYFALCYRGQTQAMGCNGDINAAGLGTTQDLAGTQLVRAPEWAGNVGFTYETPVGSALKLTLTGDMSFSDSYLTDATSNPASLQKSYELFDASIRLSDHDDIWSVALIGRNLGDSYYFTRTNDVPFTGTVAGGLTGTLSDSGAYISRGREIILRLSHRF